MRKKKVGGAMSDIVFWCRMNVPEVSICCNQNASVAISKGMDQ